MKLYDFSEYARRRDAKNAAIAVAGVVAEINNPGAVVQLKSRVSTWFALHREVLKRAAS